MYSRQENNILWNKLCSFGKGKEPLFIHCPKTGGTYVSQYESNNSSVIEPLHSIGHTFIVDNRNDKNPFYYGHDINRENNVFLSKMICGRPLFTIVRNHFDFFVSYYFHAKGINPKYRNINHYDYKNCKKGFEHLLNVIAERDDLWPNKKFIFPQVFSSKGDIIVDYIARTHTLDEDCNQFAKKYNLKYTRKLKQRVGRSNDERNLNDFYSDGMIDLVNNTWNKELNLYGFTYEEEIRKSAIIPRIVDQKHKKAIKYDYWNDRLVIL